jgi:hypothetical protein
MKALKLFKPLLLIAFFMLASTVGFSQDPGDNPDGPPPAVPIEDYMHLIIIAAGVIFALFKLKRLQSTKA